MLVDVINNFVNDYIRVAGAAPHCLSLQTREFYRLASELNLQPHQFWDYFVMDTTTTKIKIERTKELVGTTSITRTVLGKWVPPQPGDGTLSVPEGYTFQIAKPECSHEYVNQGFSSLKMVCKKCNREQV